MVVPKHRNEFDVTFDFALMMTYLHDDLICSYFWAATSVVDQPFVVMAVVGPWTLGHLLPSKWMNASEFECELETWVWFEQCVFVYCANISMNSNRIHFGLSALIGIAHQTIRLPCVCQDSMQTMAVDCVGYGCAPVAVYLAMVGL